jgi:hypothetical protein
MTDNEYLLDYLRESGRVKSDYFDALRLELDRRIYHYGKHFRREYEPEKSYAAIRRNVSRFVRAICSRKPKLDVADFQSNAYSVANVELRNLGYSVVLPPWRGEALSGASSTIKAVRLLERYFATSDFNGILSGACAGLISAVEKSLREYYRGIKALAVPFDIVFFENLSIRLFREAGKPSFVFLHGLPARYNAIDDRRGDYLVVWGDAIKEHYVRAGGNPDRIFISGRPGVGGRKWVRPRQGIEDVLVVTKSISGGQPITGDTIISDRGNLILYLYKVEDALKRAGVKKARFRPHPSENGEWYLPYLDNAFFELDKYPLSQSLAKATLVVGPTSTLLLDALQAGVEYRIFEPEIGGRDLLNYRIVAPFDGSEAGLPIAKTIKELEALVKEGGSTPETTLRRYVGDSYDLSFMKRIV